MSFLVRLVALTVVFPGDAYRLGNNDLVADSSLDLAAVRAGNAHQLMQGAMGRRVLLPMWDDIKAALVDAVAGSEHVVEFAATCNAKVAEINSHIRANNLGTIMNGDFTVADMKSTENGQSFLDVNQQLSNFFRDASQSVDISASLLRTLSEVNTLIQEVQEFSPMTASVNPRDGELLSVVASTLNVSFGVEPVCAQLGETLTPLLTGWHGLTAWGQARRAARGGESLQSSLTTMSNIWMDLGRVQASGDLQDFQNNTLRAAQAMLDASNNIESLEDRIFGSTEIIDIELCEADRTHNFFITRPVDDGTMSCVEHSYIARKTCQCRNPTDCYATSENRPEPPDGMPSKRCFRPLRRAQETIDRTLCAPEVEHSFGANQNVDLESMDCEVGYFRQTCRCHFPDDCYVRSDNLPGDSDLKRCFRPINGTLG